MKKLLLVLLLFIIVLVPRSTSPVYAVVSTSVQATAAPINLFVDGNKGNDSNDGSSSHPLKTIAAAVYQIPQVINHSVIVNVMQGTYPEDVLFIGHTGSGVFRLQGSSDLAGAQYYTVNKIQYRYNTMPVYISGFTVSTTSDVGVLAGYNPGYSEIEFMRIVTPSSYRGMGNYYSNYVLISNSLISNRAVAMYTAGGRTWSVNQSGTGNTIGLYAEKLGTIGKGGTQPEGPEAFASGGSIVPAN